MEKKYFLSFEKHTTPSSSKETTSLSSKWVVSWVCCMAVVFNLAAQRSWVVDNNVSGAGDFTAVSNASNSANTQQGDTLYLVPSPTVYPINSAKGFVIIGNGRNPSNGQGVVQVSGFVVSNSVYRGLIFSSLSINTNISNVRFERCQIGSAFNSSNTCYGSDVIFDECLIAGFVQMFNAGGDNILFTNCVFYTGASGFLTNFNSNSVNIVVSHCLIYGNGIAFSNFNPLNASFQDNIFINKNLGSSLSNTVFTNNIIYNSTNGLPWEISGSNNIDNGGNSTLSPLLVDQAAVESSTSPLTNELDFSLQPTSPGKGAGSKGMDIGLLFGGPGESNWNNSSDLGLPYILSLTLDGLTIEQGTPLNIEVQAKKGN